MRPVAHFVLFTIALTVKLNRATFGVGWSDLLDITLFI